MKKIYCTKFNKCRKFKNSTISYIFDKTLVLSIICDEILHIFDTTLVLSIICEKYGSKDKYG